MQGIGKALIEAAGNFALKNNFFKLQVITQSENTNACAFYKKWRSSRQANGTCT